MKYTIGGDKHHSKLVTLTVEPTEDEVEVILEIMRAAFYYASSENLRIALGAVCTRKNLMKHVEMENLEKYGGYVVNLDYTPLVLQKVGLQIQVFEGFGEPRTLRIYANKYEAVTGQPIEEVMKMAVSYMEQGVGFNA